MQTSQLDLHKTCDFAQFFIDDAGTAERVRLAYDGVIMYLSTLMEKNAVTLLDGRHRLSTRKNVLIIIGTIKLFASEHLHYKVACLMCLIRMMPGILDYYYAKSPNPVPTYKQAELTAAINFYVDHFCRMNLNAAEVYNGIKEVALGSSSHQ
jgi:hypothetical protein